MNACKYNTLRLYNDLELANQIKEEIGSMDRNTCLNNRIIDARISTGKFYINLRGKIVGTLRSPQFSRSIRTIDARIIVFLLYFVRF